MCGIAGIVGRHDPDLLAAMTGAVRHRGPDGDGFHIDGLVGLGHRRLAVIDLATGAQPMASADGRVVLVYNGETYNLPPAAPRADRRRCELSHPSPTPRS
jgi:asparagine synthase (glutamine-hydrolysing)